MEPPPLLLIVLSMLLLQSVLDLRIMNKDCKKEAKDFDNAVHEMAYTLGQVGPLLKNHDEPGSMLHQRG